jgi:hypothetical protein
MAKALEDKGDKDRAGTAYRKAYDIWVKITRQPRSGRRA